MSTLRAIDFACNNPDNGNFDGKVWQAEIDDNEIEARGCRRVVFAVVSRGSYRAIRIHRSFFEIKASKDWLGNWCWNRFWLEPDEMQRLLVHLREHGWTCSSGASQFRAWMNGDRV